MCMSCKDDSIGPYGKKIAEDLTSTNIIEDNYRNYYEIYVGSFYDTNNDGIGDLKGVTKKLDYIKDLGFNGIWLMPINESTSYHKYDVDDYYTIDQDYGTMADLEELIEECHSRDIKLILDLVLNHSSANNEMFINSVNAHQKYLLGMPLSSEEEKYKDFYSFYDGTTPPSGYSKVMGKNFYYECNFSTNMPEFNLDNQYAREEIKKIIDFYLDKGIDGFRLDAVKYYYLGNMSKNIAFLSTINDWVKTKNPDAYIVGEAWEISVDLLKQYYESGIDSFFNFEASISNPNGCLMNSINLDGQLCSKYYYGLESNLEMAGNQIPAPFINNHDTPRFTSKVNDHRSKFQFALLQMMNGTTFTYYGDEVGLVGSNAGGGNDQDVRIPILWGEGVGDCNPPSGTTKVEYPYPTVSEQLSDSNSILSFYKKVLTIRNQNPEIARGTIELVEMDKDISKMVISKTYNNETIGIVINFSEYNDLNVDYKKYGYSEVVGQIVVDQSADKYIGLQENGTILLPPYSIAILR